MYSAPENYYPVRQFDPSDVPIMHYYPEFPQQNPDMPAVLPSSSYYEPMLGRGDYVTMAKRGGVMRATDENKNPPWQPARSGGIRGIQAMAPDNPMRRGGVPYAPGAGLSPRDADHLMAMGYQRGGTIDDDARRQQLTYQNLISAIRPQLIDRYQGIRAQPLQPIYTGQMLQNPPSQLSGYYGELGYQGGGVADDDKKKKEEPERPETGTYSENPRVVTQLEPVAPYYYVDPAAAGVPTPTSVMPYTAAYERPMTPEQMNAEYQARTQEQRDLYAPVSHEEIANATQMAMQRYENTARDEEMARFIQPGTINIGGHSYVRDPATGKMYSWPSASYQSAGTVNPENFNFQGGGVIPPILDPIALASGYQGQAPQQQPSAVAGEPSRRRQQAPGQPRPKFTFGPEGYYYEPSEEALRKKMEEEEAMVEKAQQGTASPLPAKGGGVIPPQFMRWLARGGVIKDFGPDHAIMFHLGQKYGLAQKDAAKRLAKK